MSLICHHSAEANFSPVYDVMTDPNRFPTAWHFSIHKDGKVEQHYDYRARLRHGNSANTRGPGGEAEGRAGEPLTTAQEDAWLRIHKDISTAEGKVYLRVPGSKVGLVEHREMGQTACPSGRYDGLWERIAGGDEVTRKEYEDLVLAFAAGSEERENGVVIPREDRLTKALYRVGRIAEGLEQSLLDEARSASVNVAHHVGDHPQPEDSDLNAIAAGLQITPKE